MPEEATRWDHDSYRSCNRQTPEMCTIVVTILLIVSVIIFMIKCELIIAKLRIITEILHKFKY